MTTNVLYPTLANLDLVEFAKYALSAGFFVMPFLTYWFMLRWSFKVGAANYEMAFNVVGAIFSTLLYSYYSFTAPHKALLLANLYWFYGSAVLATVLYFALYFFYGGSVQQGQDRWVVPTAMLCYICLLSIVAVLTSIVLKHKEYYLVAGTVTLKDGPLPNETVNWSFKYRPDATQEPVVIEHQNQTDDKGRYLIGLEWTKMPKWTERDLPPVVGVNNPTAHPYSQSLDHENHVPWNIPLYAR